MRIEVNERFADEVARYALRFTCGDCVHNLGDEAGCAHEWPNEEHRPGPGNVAVTEVVFCKEFELG